MKAVVRVTVKTGSVQDAQRLLTMVCEGLVLSGSIDDYSFEIETDSGAVSEKCILSESRVIA
jgi:hypothetical protein